MRLGIDNLCLHSQGWSVPQLMEYTAAQGLDTFHMIYKQLESLDEDYLLALRHRADELGLTLELGASCVNRYSTIYRGELGTPEELIRKVAKAAKILGSSCIACFLGSLVNRVGTVPFEQQVEEFVRVVRATGPFLQELGLKLAVENHVDFLSRELAELVEEVGPEYLGVVFDAGNPVWQCEDPIMATELLAPYTLTTHIRDSRAWLVPEGVKVQWAAMGQGYVDLPRMVEILEQHAPNASFNIETITGAEPRFFAYADPECEIWRAWPDMLARDFARFIAFAQRGKPEPLVQATRPLEGPAQGELAETLKAQQLRDFETSVRYCREELGLGHRGK